MKKRNCQRTQEEIQKHETAVKIRKMTDEQLVQYIANMKDEAYELGLKTHGEIDETVDKCFKQQNVSDFISSLHPGNGIGPSTILKLRQHAEKNGFLPESEE